MCSTWSGSAQRTGRETDPPASRPKVRASNSGPRRGRVLCPALSCLLPPQQPFVEALIELEPEPVERDEMAGVFGLGSAGRGDAPSP
jgi:hypothetical protein